MHPEDAKYHHPINEIACRVATQGEDARFEGNYRIIRPDDEVRWRLGRGFSIQDESGRCVGVTGVAVDVAKEKKLSKRFEIQKRMRRTLSKLRHSLLKICGMISDHLLVGCSILQMLSRIMLMAVITKKA